MKNIVCYLFGHKPKWFTGVDIAPSKELGLNPGLDISTMANVKRCTRCRLSLELDIMYFNLN